MRALLLLLASAACTAAVPGPSTPARAPAVMNAARAESVRIPIGATVPVPGTKVTVTFEQVRDDSRCPTGVSCVWEGDAIVVLRVQGPGGAASVELHANPRFARAGSAHGVTLTLEKLEPHPEAERPVAPSAYVVTVLTSAQ